MNKEYKIKSYVIDITEDEKEEIYKKLATIFIKMAQNDKGGWKKCLEKKV